MKKILLTLFCVSFLTLTAQEADYNKWSIDLQAGAHNVSQGFTPGYFTDELDFYQVSAGVRYMFNNKFGMKLDAGYNSIENDDDSFEFTNRYFRGTIQGIANLGPILGISDVCENFTILAHGGFGYASAKAENISFGNDEDDAMAHAIIGLTPQFKISERVTFTTDVSLIGNIGQEVAWDGQSGLEDIVANDGEFVNTNAFPTSIVNFSAGLTINLGSKATHADWYNESNEMQSEIDSLKNRLTQIEEDLLDDDNDGVANYIDEDDNTPAGTAVDAKGVAVDANDNGIPDTMEAPLDARYAQKGDMNTETDSTSDNDLIAELLDKGYVNVYFAFNSSKPQTYSLDAINYLVMYMNDNTSASAQLIGYADEIGGEAYNERLSEARARRVYDILIASGIDAGRLTHQGNGEDDSVDKNSAGARQLARRVTFKLN